MFSLIQFIPHGTKLDFIGKRKFAIVLSVVLIVASIVSVGVRGLNFGIDFSGGLLVEVQTSGPADMAELRRDLNTLGIGEVALQRVGGEADQVMIRVQKQEGGEEAQMAALDKVKEALGAGVEYRRTEMVGPKVGQEFIIDGALAVGLAILAIVAYITFRFEWHFGVGAMVALLHDVVATVGIFSILGLEFNLTTVAALLTIAGYSINDTVVVYDRVRENLRKYKKLALADLMNQSLNEMLSRTILTSGTTLLAVLSIFVFGGEVLRGFAFALIWGIVIGTYSSMYIALPVLLQFNIGLDDTGRGDDATQDEADEEPGEDKAPAGN